MIRSKDTVMLSLEEFKKLGIKALQNCDATDPPDTAAIVLLTMRMSRVEAIKNLEKLLFSEEGEE